MSTTRWKDNKTVSLNEAIDLLLDDVPDEVKSSGNCWKNIKTRKIFSENKNINLNGRNIEYNLVKCSYDQIRVDNAFTDDRTLHKYANIIVYFTGSTVKYIITLNTSAKKLLRMLLSYTGKNELIEDNYKLSNDLFFWLISKVYNMENIIESDDDNLSDLRLETIRGFKGDVEDEQTKVSASGEAVMNIISALSFLLESKRLKQIKLDLQYGKHENLSLILKNESIMLDRKSYQGTFEQDDQDECLAKLYLVVYLEVLPIIEQEYQSNIDNDVWNKRVYIDFMKTVATTISERIDEKIKKMNDRNNYAM